MRNDLRSVNASYMIAKKTLMKKALQDALNIEVDLADLPGQIGAVCSYDDAVAGLGKVNDVVKKTKGEKVEWTVCVFEGELKNHEDTKEIAGMPSRETLLGRLVGSMQSPLSSLARFFDAAAKDIEEGGKTKLGELEGVKTDTAPTEAEAPKEEAAVKETQESEATTEEKKEETKEA